jgi:hypothetical protein
MKEVRYSVMNSITTKNKLSVVVSHHLLGQGAALSDIRVTAVD